MMVSGSAVVMVSRSRSPNIRAQSENETRVELNYFEINET